MLRKITKLIILLGFSALAFGQSTDLPKGAVLSLGTDSDGQIEVFGYDLENADSFGNILTLAPEEFPYLAHWKGNQFQQLLVIKVEASKPTSATLTSGESFKFSKRPKNIKRIIVGRDIDSSGRADVVLLQQKNSRWVWSAIVDPFSSTAKEVRLGVFGRSHNRPFLFRLRGRRDWLAVASNFKNGRRPRISLRRQKSGRVRRIRLPREVASARSKIIALRQGARDVIGVIVDSKGQSNGEFYRVSRRGDILSSNFYAPDNLVFFWRNAKGDEVPLLVGISGNVEYLEEEKKVFSSIFGTPFGSNTQLSLENQDTGIGIGNPAFTPLPTPVPTALPINTPVSTPTLTAAATATLPATPSKTITVTVTPSATATQTVPATPTETATPTPTATPTSTFTATPTPQTVFSFSASSTVFSASSGVSPSASALLTLSNTGNKISQVLGNVSFGGTNPSNFEIVSENCSGSALGAGSSCTLSVRMVVSENGSYSTIVNISDGLKASSLTLSGTASGFIPKLTLSPASSSSMDISGSSPGGAVTFTVTNTGKGSTAPLSTPVITGSESSNFELLNDACSSAVLAASETCTFDIRPVATENGGYSAIVAIDDMTVSSNSAALSGTASDFCSPATTLSSTGFYSNDFNTDISGWSRSGSGGGSTFTNITSSDWGGNTGAYWSPDTGNGDRALTFYKSNAGGIINWSRTFTNTTGSPITAISLTYDFEVHWHRFNSSNNRTIELDVNLSFTGYSQQRSDSSTLDTSVISADDDLTWLCDSKIDSLNQSQRNITSTFSGLNIAAGQSFTISFFDNNGAIGLNQNINGGVDNLIINVSN